MQVPTLHTQRLVLRAHAPDDFDAHAALWADPAVTRFIGGRPVAREEAWARFVRYAGMWQVMGFGFWAITDRETGAFVGEAGFQELRRQVEPGLEGSLEAGWAIASEFHRRGYAAEAVAAILDWAAEAQPGRRITCMIEPSNAPSLRIASRSGFREFARTLYKGANVILLER